MGFWRDNESGGKGEEVLESEGKGMLENGNSVLHEVVDGVGVREFIEKNALSSAREKPWYVKERKGDGG